MSAIISATGLERTYELSRGLFARPAVLKAVADATFTVKAGRTLGVVGESGSGKSTLARLLTMIEPATAGRLWIDGIEIRDRDRETLKRLRATIQIVFQDPYGSLNPRHKVGTIVEEPLVINTPMRAAERRKKALSVLADVGLRPEHYGRYPHMFSGGQRQRIAIARTLTLEPKILILDEPVSALDVSIQAQILNLLWDLQERFGLTYVFISHDLSVVRHVAHEVIVMYMGKMVEIADVKEIFATPRHPYTRALLSATPVADPTHRRERIRVEGEPPSPFDPPSGCVFHPRCMFANERCRIEKPQLIAADGTQVACHAVEEGRI